jgi:hypothetical protein
MGFLSRGSFRIMHQGSVTYDSLEPKRRVMLLQNCQLAVFLIEWAKVQWGVQILKGFRIELKLFSTRMGFFVFRLTLYDLR